MNNFTKLLVLLCSFFVANIATAQISGTVFRDYNGNGTRQTTAPTIEPGVAGIIINAYNALDALIATQTSSATGTYAFPATGANSVGNGTAVRLEFIIPSSGSCLNPFVDNSSINSANSRTSVQFVTGGAAAVNINYGVSNPADYISTTNPTLYTPVYVAGNPLGGGTTGTTIALARFTYTSTGTTAPTTVLTQSQIGTVWGLAYSKSASRLFAASFVKRQYGLGPGTGNTSLPYCGTIYNINPTANSVASYCDLDALGFPTHAASGALNVLSNTARGLGPNRNSTFQDATTFDQIGKVGLGDLEISDDNRYLFVTNLFDRKLYRIDMQNGSSPVAPTAAQVTSWAIPNPGCTNGVARPFATKYYRGKVYVGVVCTGENAGTNANLNAYIYEFNPAGAGSFNATPVLTFPLNYAKGFATAIVPCNTANTGWFAWTAVNPPDCGSPGSVRRTSYPQPILSDIEFDDQDGSIIVSFMDRYGHQMTLNNNGPTDAFTDWNPRVGGDILRAYKNSGCTNWTLESNGDKDGPGAYTASVNQTNAQGPGGGEFYWDDQWSNGTQIRHAETVIGGMAILPGSQEIVVNLYDNIDGAVNQFTNGTSRLSNNTGTRANNYQLLPDATIAANAGYAGKSNGLGDLEMVQANPPIEIGNRIWNDANGDGIQNPGEASLANVTLELFLDANNDGVPDGAAIGTVTTNATGNYYFTNATGTDVTGIDYGVAIATNQNYIIRVAAADWNSTTGAGVGDLAGLGITRVDKIGNGAADLSDNDASLTTGAAVVPQVRLTTGLNGQNNHNFDFGFKALTSLGDKVWLDNGTGANAGNGVQDAGEPGVAGVTVTLKDNAGNVLATTVTDSYGNYLFDNLNPGNYTVTVTPPANYTFTTQTNTVDNTAGTAPIATGSDVNATTGQSYIINLVAGENEGNIDAGLVFSQPTTVSLGDKVWFDNGAGGGTGGNGVQDGAEPGVAGVTVTLYASNGTTVLATTVTDANGNYRFNNLTAGTQYIAGFTPPAGFIFTGKDLGGNDNTDSDVNTTAGATFGKTDLLAALTAGENRTSVDAGLVQQAATAASVGDRLWNDLNQNGIQDAGEPGVAGVTVTLYQNGTAIATTVTDVFGNYIFNSLTAGTGYQVGITLPAGYTLSPSDQGTDNKLDNDIQTALSNRTPVFPLTVGLRNLTLDAGIYQTTPAGTAKLGDKVWFDANGNGTQDGGNEAGVPGLTVELLNSTGASIDPDGAGPLTKTITVTDANGNYQFVNLAAGSYIVAFSNIPSGYNFTQQVTPGDNGNNTNSDANPLSGRSSVIALTAGESDQTIDAGLVAGTSSGLGSLGNKIWYDLNSNGLQDAGELGVSGVTVTLFDAGPDGLVGNADDGTTRTIITNALGEYLFTGLTASNYAVQFGTAALPLPAGFTVTGQNTGTDDNIDSDGGAIATGGAPAGSSRTAVISLTAGEDNLSIDLGLIAPANTNTLGDKVWADNGAGGGIANDGVQNGTEPGIAGVTVTLYNNAGTAIATTTTDANGQYLFAGLANGTYSVGFTNLPAGFSFTTTDTDGVPGNGTLDSDADRITGRTATVILNAANRNDRTLDAGLVSTRAALGNFVWYDTNGDGDQDAGEAGVPGVTVGLYFDANNDGDFLDAGENVPASSMITDQNGGYFFPNLLPGNYQIGFTTIAAGVNFTTQDAGGNDALDSDIIPSTGRTATVNLSPGEVDLTVDAGLFRPQATVGNFIWVDNGAGGGTSGNGVQDGTEPGLPGIIVTLFDANTNLPIATTVTDGSGGYVFNNVPPGTYYLQIGNLPSGATISPQDAGGNDNADNDFNPATSRTANFTVPPNAVNLSFDGGVLADLSTLPVRITAFTVIKKNNTAELNWKVEAETGVNNYVVEISSDGRNFTSIASVNAAGASSYSSTDAQPLKGLNYYRLKVVDLDGSIAYSEVRIVVFGSKGVINVFPNPSADRINILLPESWQNKAVTIDIIDQLGRVVIKVARTQAGQVEIINISKLPGAAYLLRLINSDGEQEVRKIQVTK